MSVEFYNEMAEVANELLEEFGAPVTTTRKSDGKRDPVTGETIQEPSTQSLEANGVLLEYEQRMIDGTNIQHGDKLLMLDNGFEPQSTDILNHVGKDWQVVHILPQQPATVAVAYTVQVRR